MGKYGDFKVTCIDIPPGFYGDQCIAGQKGCSTIKECFPGSYCAGAKENPEVCLPGTYANLNGLPRCLSCSPGQAIDMTNKTNCALCKIGQFANTSALKTCINCPSGRTTFVKGSVQCSDCPKGKAGVDGHCDRCIGLTHAEKDGLKHCVPCPQGLTPDAAHVTCVKSKIEGNGPRIFNVIADLKTSSLHFQFTFDGVNPPEGNGFVRTNVSVTVVDEVTKENVATRLFAASKERGVIG